MSRQHKLRSDPAEEGIKRLLFWLFLAVGLAALVLWLVDPDRAMHGVLAGCNLMAAVAMEFDVRRRRNARAPASGDS